MDVRRDFCEIAIAEDGNVRAAGRIATEPAALELFARSLVASDEVAIEATANALAIARIIEPRVRRVVLANPKAVRETSRRAKTDKIDAKVLAQLLAVGFLDRVWTPDEAARTRRRLISRAGRALVRPRALDDGRTARQHRLGAVPQHNAGVASGAINAISRVAGLLAIAAGGAVVAAQFGSALDDELAGRPLDPAARAAVREVKAGPLSGGVEARPALDGPVEAASVHAYRVGLGVGGG